MPEEPGVASWKEDNVREKVLLWYIEKSKPQPEQTYQNEGNDQDYTHGYKFDRNEISENARTTIIEKIEENGKKIRGK